MELQKTKDEEQLQEDPRTKTLKTTTPSPSKPSPPSGLDQTPHSPTSSSLLQEPVHGVNTTDLRKVGEEGGEQKGTETPSAEVADGLGSESAATALADPATDIQKKLRRAERFGMPVQISEEEKRSSRAERFGTRSALQGTSEAGNLEEHKRKARAERFGLAGHSPTNEEVKKKARLERFAQSSKPDTLEEEKIKARAIRFSETSSASSGANGTANSELNTTAVAKT